MHQRLRIPTCTAKPLALVAAGGLVALSCALAPADQAWAVTAAEKQAEADAVYAQIDSLQTSLNGIMDEYKAAQGAYEEASAAQEEAARKVEEESKRIDTLQTDLSGFAVGMYKKGTGTFLDVILESTTFGDFLTSWDACNAIAARGSSLLAQARDAREELEEAERSYEEQGKRAEEQMQAAQEAQERIEQTQAALRSEAEQLSQEAAELQLQEELAAEAARQAEEARKQREAELAAAQKAAEEEAARQAEAQAAGQEAQTDWQEVQQPAEASQAVAMGTGYFCNPCPDATNSSGFGYRTFDNSFHKGLDMAAPQGTPYYAADNGTVMYATNDGGYNGGAGNWVVISHGNGIVTKYMHSSVTYVKPGDYVERGQNIGAVGNTGDSFGPHLHFQVEVNGVAVNPLNYI